MLPLHCCTRFIDHDAHNSSTEGRLAKSPSHVRTDGLLGTYPKQFVLASVDIGQELLVLGVGVDSVGFDRPPWSALAKIVNLSYLLITETKK